MYSCKNKIQETYANNSSSGTEEIGLNLNF